MQTDELDILEGFISGASEFDPTERDELIGVINEALMKSDFSDVYNQYRQAANSPILRRIAMEIE